MNRHVEYLSSEDAACYLGHVHADGTPNMRAFKAWLTRRNKKPDTKVTTFRLGRRLRFRKVDLESCVEAK